MKSYPDFLLHLFRAAISASVFYCDEDGNADNTLKSKIHRVPKKKLQDFTFELPTILLDGPLAKAKPESQNSPKLIWTEAGPLSSVYRSLLSALGEPTKSHELVHKIQDELQFFGVNSELVLDSLISDRKALTLPLWSDSVDDSNALSVKELGTEWLEINSDPTWAFWRKWYQGFLDGRPIDWELQSQVALIDDAVWEDGPEAVAQAIREIERELAGPAPLEDAVLRKHVEHLLKNPVLSEATALNGAENIERAISDYLREAPANGLPEDLKHLEALPQHFKAIARVIGSQTSEDKKEKRLAKEISKLHSRVAELEKELAVAKGKELKGIISQEAAKSLGKTIGSLPFLGGLAIGTCYFFGASPSDLTLENLRDYLGELSRTNLETTVPSNPSLPPSTDV